MPKVDRAIESRQPGQTIGKPTLRETADLLEPGPDLRNGPERQKPRGAAWILVALQGFEPRTCGL